MVVVNSKSRAFTMLMYTAAKLSGTKKVILMFPHLRKYLRPSRHVVESYKASLRDGGFKFDEGEKPTLKASITGRLFAQQLLEKNGIFKEKHTLVGFCPMSLAKIKEWSANNFAQLGNKLLQQDAVRIILFGYNNPDRARCIAEKMHRKPVIVYRLTFENLIGLINECDLFVSVDCGPMHIAAALDVPTVGIFGPTSGKMWGPYNENSVVLQKDIQCPCYVPNIAIEKKPQTCFQENRCITGPINCIDRITVDEVFLAIQQLCPSFRVWVWGNLLTPGRIKFLNWRECSNRSLRIEITENDIYGIIIANLESGTRQNGIEKITTQSSRSIHHYADLSVNGPDTSRIDRSIDRNRR